MHYIERGTNRTCTQQSKSCDLLLLQYLSSVLHFLPYFAHFSHTFALSCIFSHPLLILVCKRPCTPIRSYHSKPRLTEPKSGS